MILFVFVPSAPVFVAMFTSDWLAIRLGRHTSQVGILQFDIKSLSKDMSDLPLEIVSEVRCLAGRL